MSGYRGRNGPNLQNYLNNLNTVSPPYDSTSFDDLLDLNQDLSIFTNTDFTSMDDPSFNFELPNNVKNNNVGFEEFLPGAPQPQTINTQSPAESSQFYSNYNTPIQPAPVPTFQQAASPITSVESQIPKKTDTTSGVSAEEKSRLAAEEDKRRRNTAASARFRVKKKQREQALEQTLKETQEKSAKFEARITQLEMENKWLKELITEKHGLQSEEEIAAAFQKYRKESEERDVKETQPHTTGVGTN